MKTVIKIEKETDELSIGWFDGEKDEWVDFETMSDDELKTFCAREDFRELLVEAIKQFCEQTRETIGTDLESIWKRLDALEAKIQKP